MSIWIDSHENSARPTEMEDNSGVFVGLAESCTEGLNFHQPLHDSSDVKNEGTVHESTTEEVTGPIVQGPVLSIPEHTFNSMPYPNSSEFHDVFVITQEQDETLQLQASKVVATEIYEDHREGSNLEAFQEDDQSDSICDNQNTCVNQTSESSTGNCEDEGTSVNEHSKLQEGELVFVSEQYNEEEMYPNEDISKEHVANLRTQDIDDYIDIVTTYKCRFCSFSCAWKAGLQSHIRNCHLPAENDTANTKPNSKVPNRIQSKTKQLERSELITASIAYEMCDNPGASNREPLEKHIFLCGECSKGFDTLYLCKQHMIKDHDFTYPDSFLSVNQKSKKTQKRFGCKRKAKESQPGSQEPCVAGDIGLKPSQSLLGDPEVMAGFIIDNRKKRDYRDSDKSFRCNETGCGSRFMSESNLEYHSQCHVSEDNTFSCPECSERFEHWRRLLVHLWKEHLIDIDLLTCEECGYKTYSQFKMGTHQKIHGDARDYMCSTCGKRFKQVSQLRNHSVIHLDRNQRDGDGPKRWYNTQECDICGRTFSDSKCLRKHQQAVHNKLKPYVCNFCGHTSARKAMLQLHMRQHTGEKPFSCEHCDYKTGDHNSLRRHRMRHTGSKPYKCAHCPYSCIQAISLKTHMKNKHPGLEGLYACGLCNFHSVRKDSFIQHMSDHKRGIISSTNTAHPLKVLETPQLHLTEGSSEQLNGNMVSAQLICSCLNVLTQDGEAVDLPPGVVTTGENGTQTITIQIPTSADQETGEQYYFTIQQDVDSLTGHVTELGLLENGELKLPDQEVMNVSDFIISQPSELQT